MSKKKIVIVTGLSGSGKTTALNGLFPVQIFL